MRLLNLHNPEERAGSAPSPDPLKDFADVPWRDKDSALEDQDNKAVGEYALPLSTFLRVFKQIHYAKLPRKVTPESLARAGLSSESEVP